MREGRFLGGGGGGGHACGFPFNFSKVTENAIITIKLLIFFHIFSDEEIQRFCFSCLELNAV